MQCMCRSTRFFKHIYHILCLMYVNRRIHLARSLECCSSLKLITSIIQTYSKMDRKPAQTNDKPFITVVSCIKKQKKNITMIFFISCCSRFFQQTKISFMQQYELQPLVYKYEQPLHQKICFGNLISFCLHHPEMHCITIFMMAFSHIQYKGIAKLLMLSERTNQRVNAYSASVQCECVQNDFQRLLNTYFGCCLIFTNLNSAFVMLEKKKQRFEC